MAMMSDEFAYRSAAELAGMVRRRQISPVELMDKTIARIEKRNPSLNALIYLAFDEARREARRAEAAVMKGEVLPPLHGVPAAIKDLFDFKPGWPTTFGGVRALKNNIAQFYCPFAERIEKGGAILVGKTNSPVMGLRGIADNPLFGPTANPAAPRGGARLPSPTASSPSPRAPMPAARSAFLPPGVASTATRLPSAASRSSSGRMPFPATCHSSARGRSRAPSRTPRLL
jgi:amidase/aspartyl-tRNA(Asn)/glutamyl-tRNA(Gln) amidotransferase subunit A